MNIVSQRYKVYTPPTYEQFYSSANKNDYMQINRIDFNEQLTRGFKLFYVVCYTLFSRVLVRRWKKNNKKQQQTQAIIKQ